MTTGEVLWTPPADVLETSRIGDYVRWLGRDGDYHALWRWSVEDLPGFWRSIWDYFGVVAHAAPTATLADRRMPGARWFPGARLNYAEHVLRMPGRADDEVIVLGYSQTRDPVTLTAAQLRERVRRVRAGLRRLGVQPGDRVAAYAPNIPETFVLLLATASLGAVFSSCAPEFGTRSVVDRWQQIEPKVLVAVDGYRYGAKTVDRSAEVSAITESLPSLEHVVTLSYLDGERVGWAGIAYFGTSAPYLLSCRKAGIKPAEIADLAGLRGLGSTGAPLPPEGFHWVYDEVSPTALLASASGGTDVCTAFVGGVPLLPVYAGEITCRCLGAKVEAYAGDGTPVIGELGELVITEPMPSMPVGFWNDPTGERYREAYFSTYPGVWRHGDWITITERGTCVITGRSDATLNRGGVRLGTSEFYSVVEGLDAVL